MKEWIIKYWIEVAFGAITAAIAWAYRSLSKKIRVKTAENEAIKEGVTALLHDRLYQECPQYIHHGEIAVEDLKNIEYMYNAYHALGGNGTGTELYNRVKALKIKEDT